MVKHENPEKFKAFVNAAEAQPVAWVVSEKTGDSRADESPGDQPNQPLISLPNPRQGGGAPTLQSLSQPIAAIQSGARLIIRSDKTLWSRATNSADATTVASQGPQNSPAWSCVSITLPGLGKLLAARGAGASCGGFGFARNTTSFDIFNWLQVTANFGDVPLLQSAPNRPDYIDVWALWLHGHDL